jgi:cytochrome c oxidase subunit 1
MDRTVGTGLFVTEQGGSPYLWQNVFWFFGHPEVYILALPGFGLAAEMLPVFTRRRLYGYNVSAAGMIGVTFLSFFVWQHHLFMSGINGNMRPLFMLTTELISIPTGFIYMVAMGTLWRGRIRLEVPMLFVIAFYLNFLIGGVSGVFISDVPADVTLHGSFFVQAHFHYTIMGGLIFAFFGAIYYYTPKMTGYELNKRLAKIHFWIMFPAFQLTFIPLFIVGSWECPVAISSTPPNGRRSTMWPRSAPTSSDCPCWCSSSTSRTPSSSCAAGPGRTLGIHADSSGRCRRPHHRRTSIGSRS